jgi:(hydroxyamino)benzene mutase
MARRLAFHGLLLFLLSMLEGMFVQKMAVPRMGLSAHVGGAMSGLFLMALAGIWREVQLSPRAAKIVFWTSIVSFYLSSAGLLYAALFATHNSTPMNGAPLPGSPLHEAVTAALTGGGGAGVLFACVLGLWGLSRGRD